MLFPAEQSYYERLFSLIDKSDPAAIEKLFAPLVEAERKMGVNDKVWPKRTFTLEQVDLLNRSPHYPEWRKAAAGIFAVLDPLLDREVALKGRPRLVIVLSPAELPVGPDRMWTRIAKFGKRLPVQAPQESTNMYPCYSRERRALNAARRSPDLVRAGTATRSLRSLVDRAARRWPRSLRFPALFASAIHVSRNIARG